MAFGVGGCPVIWQQVTCPESTGTAPSLSALLPDGLSYGFGSFLQLLISFFLFKCISLISSFPRRSRVVSTHGGHTLDLFPLTCVRMGACDLRGCVHYDRMQVF